MRQVAHFVLLIVSVLGSWASPSLAQQSLPYVTEHLGINVTQAPLDNLLLRQAVASAINRQVIFEAARGKFPPGWIVSGPAGSWFPPVLPQHSDVRIHPYDPSVARELLARAGFPGGRGLPTFEILYRQDRTFGPFRQVEAELVGTQLLVLGINAKAVGIASGTTFFERVNPGAGKTPQYQMAVYGWSARGNPPDFLASMFLQGGALNGYGYRNPEVTVLITDALKETDPVKRIAMLREAEKLVLTDAPVVPLLYFNQPPP